MKPTFYVVKLFMFVKKSRDVRDLNIFDLYRTGLYTYTVQIVLLLGLGEVHRW
jgi:hypothetical protein